MDDDGGDGCHMIGHADERETEEFVEDLKKARRATEFLDDHKFSDRTLSEYLNQLLEEKGLERKDVVKAAGINDIYGYDIFTSKKKRHPGRNYLISLAFTMGLTCRECDRLLKLADRSVLYPKNRRDAIIMFCLERHTTFDEVNMELYRRGEETLTKKD